jgi:hypothetical protein
MLFNYPCQFLKHETIRVREEKVEGGSERDYFKGRGHRNCPGLKVPRQCPLILLVEVRLREGKALGSEKGEGLKCGLCYEQGFYCL